ncbi:unnamed protein product [Protopolystoma xenopodis]|uniref:Uncharacterized protein n=1 Tax=Protopolystoma xenopodis TaxID=117903 RepID=A0A448X1A1_9PLAT|nr:unnamed protein product [Protopolystoma xenopodis]
MQRAVKRILSTEMHRIIYMMRQMRDQVASLRDLTRNYERSLAQKDRVIEDLMTDFSRSRKAAESAILDNHKKREVYSPSR